MCGIVGVVGFASSEEGRARAARMNAAIVHRGPDDEGLWAGEGVAFGMRRLSIIDLAGGHQPMWTDDGVGIVFNGEIYNFLALRRELEASGYVFCTHSDTEVLLKLYHRDGLAGMARLEGMFAFCIYDSRHNVLHLVRDRMGVKPLYYGNEAGSFFFASEIKAILAGMASKPPLNRQALHDYLTLRFVPSPETIWQGVFKLRPGHILTLRLTDGSTENRCYWYVDFHSAPLESGRDYPGEFEKLFLAAVEKRLLASDVPVGVLLSGGLDSSAVSAAAIELGHRDFHTFSVGFEDGGVFDESAYARQVANHIGSQHHEIKIGQRDFLDSLPMLAYYTDEPLADLAAIPLYFVSRLASKDVKVVLSGEGADEVLAGYNMERLAAMLHWLNVTPLPLVKLGAYVFGRSRFGAILQNWAMKGQDNFFSVNPYHMTLHWNEAEKRRLWGGKGNGGFASSEETIRNWYRECMPSTYSLDALQQVYCREWLVEDLLMKADKMSMAVSIELREPFLDHALVEWAATLPQEWKVGNSKQGFVSKRVLREYAQERLPKAILERPKQGFPVPAYRWLSGPLNKWAEDMLCGYESRFAGYFDVATLKPVLEAAGRGNDNAAHKIWVLLVAEYWMRQWL